MAACIIMLLGLPAPGAPTPAALCVKRDAKPFVQPNVPLEKAGS